MLDINPVYKSYLLSPLDLTSFNGFCLVVCYLSSVFLKSAYCLVIFLIRPLLVCSKSFWGDERSVLIFLKNLSFMFTVRFVDPGLELTQHLYFMEKDQPLY